MAEERILITNEGDGHGKHTRIVMPDGTALRGVYSVECSADVNGIVSAVIKAYFPKINLEVLPENVTVQICDTQEIAAKIAQERWRMKEDSINWADDQVQNSGTELPH